MVKENQSTTRGSPDVLGEILEQKHREIKRLLPKVSNKFKEIFKDRSWPAVIAEIKPRSPSGGSLYSGEPLDLVGIYVQGGAKAISVLTDKKYFGGSPDLFTRVRMSTHLPLLRKDFIISPRQVLETADLEADALLLIVTALKREKIDLKSMIDLSNAINVAPVVEVYDQQELEAALDADAQIIGVNSRNLSTLEENIDQALEVLAKIPKEQVALLFSSIKSRDDVLKAHQAGAKGVLVGTALLKASDPVAKLRELTNQ